LDAAIDTDPQRKRVKYNKLKVSREEALERAEDLINTMNLEPLRLQSEDG